MLLAFIFDSVGFGEWFMLLAVVLIVVGPRRLPSVARNLGQYYSRFRRAADNFKRQLLDMDTEIGQAVREVEDAVDAAERSVDETVDDIERTAAAAAAEVTPPVPAETPSEPDSGVLPGPETQPPSPEMEA